VKLISSSHATHQIGVHIIFCPKYRHQVLSGAVKVKLKRVISETCIHYNWLIQAIEIMPDHVHLFVQLDPFVSPNEVARTINSITAIQIFTLFPKLKSKKFWGSGLWSRGTYYGSVGQVSEDTIRKYIESQKQGSNSSPGTRPGVFLPRSS
jgi:putative transposase